MSALLLPVIAPGVVAVLRTPIFAPWVSSPSMAMVMLAGRRTLLLLPFAVLSWITALPETVIEPFLYVVFPVVKPTPPALAPLLSRIAPPDILKALPAPTQTPPQSAEVWLPLISPP